MRLILASFSPKSPCFNVWLGSGTPAAVLENAELLAMFLPVLRADFAMIEAYHPRLSLDAPSLSCPIWVAGGVDDTVRFLMWPMQYHVVCVTHVFVNLPTFAFVFHMHIDSIHWLSGCADGTAAGLGTADNGRHHRDKFSWRAFLFGRRADQRFV